MRGQCNTADGFQVLFHNITGAGNTAIGYHALLNNNGSSNIALGLNAGINFTTGSNNIDIGNLGAVGESNTIRIWVAPDKDLHCRYSGTNDGKCKCRPSRDRLGGSARHDQFLTAL